MASILIRDLDEETESRLRAQAARHRRSIEGEAREILEHSLAADQSAPMHLVDTIRRRIEPFGGIELPTTKRGRIRKPPRF